MSVNWTGSGSFYLGQRRKQRQRHSRPRRRYDYQDRPEYIDDWLTNTCGNPGIPPLLASSPLPPLERRHDNVKRGSVPVEDAHAKTSDKDRREESSAERQHRSEGPTDRQREEQTQQSASVPRRTPAARNDARLPSRRELCDWLLSKPDWVGPPRVQKRPARDAEESSPKAPSVVQPIPTPMLDNNSHSK